MSLFNHRRPFQRQSSLQNDHLTTPPSTRVTSSHRNHSASGKYLPGSLPKPNKAPLIGILRNKQRSEEIPDRCQVRSIGNRATSALGQLSKQHVKVPLKDRPNNRVKVAWGDEILDLGEGIEGLEPLMAKKEVVLNKVLTNKFARPNVRLPEKFSISSDRGQDLVLCNREQLAQRLKIAWQEREASKKNLNIILRPTIKTEDSLEDPDCCGGEQTIVNSASSKELDDKVSIKVPNNNFEENNEEKKPANIVDVTNIFHRSIRRRSFLKYEQQSQNNYEPSKNYGNADTKRSSTILVIPILENNLKNIEIDAINDSNSNIKIKVSESSGLSEQSTNIQENDEKVNVDKINIEASQKRELFQKRNNFAFNNTVDMSPNNIIPSVANKPKLIRASSVPSKYTSKPSERPSQVPAVRNNTNIIPKRRRIKSSTTFVKRNNTRTCDSLASSAINNARTVNEHHYVGLNQGDQQTRQMYQHSKDIVTMVSLLSPNITDNEEELDSVERQVTLVDENKDKKSNDKGDLRLEKTPKMQHGFTSLRKTVKSVSFQQSSIHSVRSFCVSFPGRRGSVGTTGTINSTGTTHQSVNHKKQYNNANASVLHNGINSNNINKSQEKWGSSSEGDEGAGKPKRRLVRTISESNDGCYTSEMSNANQATTPMVTSQVQSPISDPGDSINSQSSTLSEATVVQTVSDKEAYCMNTYRKLTDSGINISLETIFRGMLTPTEYRLRCQREDAAAAAAAARLASQPQVEEIVPEDDVK